MREAVPQMYLAFPASADEPPRLLRGFANLYLEPSSSTTATFTMAQRDWSTWDPDAYAWKQATGTFTVYVGASSRDLRLNGTFDIAQD
jgi:beta-glucosidase